ncbi:MAG: hypothetical protein G01um101416_871 [Microgenomates group bacterium Gr01-1014_16]|nr:MAG: hypothetical protein G01um101416_871 [Microgenomates group bacterium Gr01-1014_16]
MLIRVPCAKCGKEVDRSRGRINEANKFGWKTYCSLQCQNAAKNLQIETKCYRDGCNVRVRRRRDQFRRFGVVFCSMRCAALVNNKKYPREHGVTKVCAHCSKLFKSREKYCSRECKDRASVIPREVLLGKINDFFSREGRVPFKNEIGYYHAVRSRFGTWNEAIIAAGFEPNPVMFANRHIAKDGHQCDSLAEKIIDDWMFARKIEHRRRVYYPCNHGLSADFMIGDYWIEFFGLFGEHKRYDQLRKLKLRIAKTYKLKLLEIYPHDLFPKNNLAQILSSCIT